MPPINTPDPDNTDLWPDADVYVSFEDDPTFPNEGEEFGAEWFFIGLLDGEEGIVEKAEWGEENEYYAWGGIMFRRSRSKFKYSRTFTAFERNYATDRLRWPGSTETTLVVPDIERVTVAFETRDAVVTDEVRRIMSHAKGAEITPQGDVTENEKDPTKWVFEAVFFPDADGEFATRQESTDLGS